MSARAAAVDAGAVSHYALADETLGEGTHRSGDLFLPPCQLTRELVDERGRGVVHGGVTLGLERDRRHLAYLLSA